MYTILESDVEYLVVDDTEDTVFASFVSLDEATQCAELANKDYDYDEVFVIMNLFDSYHITLYYEKYPVYVAYLPNKLIDLAKQIGIYNDLWYLEKYPTCDDFFPDIWGIYEKVKNVYNLPDNMEYEYRFLRDFVMHLKNACLDFPHAKIWAYGGLEEQYHE